MAVFDWIAQRFALAVAPLLNAMENRIVSVLSDKIAAASGAQATASASLDAALARVALDVAKFQTTIDADNAKIAELQALVDQGTASPADIQALEALTQANVDMQAKLDALDPTSETTLPTG